MRASSVRRITLVAALVSAVLTSLSCGGDSGSPTPTPNSVLVSPGADTLISIGSHRTFTAQVLDANGDPIDGKTVTWSSSAPGILSIDPTTGVATAVTNGHAVVHAASGTLQGSANVIVLQLVASVTVTPGSAAFTSVGDTARFTAVAKDSGGTVVAGVQILWTTSDNSVATVDTLGLARAKGAGTALVSAQAQTRAGYAAIGVDPMVAQVAVLIHPDSAVAGEPTHTALQVELWDSLGNRVMGSSLPISVSLGGAGAGSPLHGTTTMLADQGRATFTGLWLEKAGVSRWRIKVGGLVDSTTTVVVAPAAPIKVFFDSLGDSFVAGASLGVHARVADQFGNSTTNYTGPVRVRVIAGAGLGALFGDTVVAAAAGIADFATLNIHIAGTPYRLTAAIPDVPSSVDTSTEFTVGPSTPQHFEVAYLSPPPVGILRAGDTSVVAVTDSFGNAVADGSVQVSVHPLYWGYAAPPGRELRLLGDTVAGTFQGHALFQVAASRPGRIVLEFSVTGLGADTTDNFVTPFLIEDGGSMLAMGQSSCLLATLCTGDNGYGQLGVPTAAVALDSVPIPRDSLFTGSVFLADGGGRHACVAVVDPGFGARIDCWGDNSDGQLGGGTVGGTSETQVSGLTFPSVDVLSAGGSHTCAAALGTTWCWGRNADGQLGDGSPGASTGTPVAVVGGHNFTALAAGGRHTCGLEPSGGLWCWGANDFGQLGNGDSTGAASATPVQVRVPDSLIFSEISAGDDFTCATSYQPGNHEVYCWGRNDARQLATGTDSAMSRVPVLALHLGGTADLSGGTLTTGARFACVGTHGGDPFYQTLCWGANEYGQLGRSSFSPSDSLPVQAFFGDQGLVPMKLVAGAEFICGATLHEPSQFICWGRNDHGEFGSGNTNNSTTPLIGAGSY